jgi:peroxiredoxin Q/BCP
MDGDCDTVMMKKGDPVPEFALASEAGTVSSQDLKGRRYVLYFYPKDDTPGCTVEACEFRDNLPKFEKVGVPVLGVSADDLKAHAKFTKKHGLNFTLLADPDRTLIEALGLWVEKSMYGKKYMGVQRSTFVVDENGRIAQIWEKVKPEGHAEEVLAWLNSSSNQAQ